MSEKPIRQRLDFGGWPNGVDSLANPLAKPVGQERWAVNARNRGGVWGTRPGFKTRATVSTVIGSLRTNVQGMTWFTPTNGGPFLVWAVSGMVWAAPLKVDGSLGELRLLGGVQFSPDASQIVFQRCVQTQTVIEGVAAKPVTARNLLIMQDGGSRACYWDGTVSGSLNPQENTTTNGSGDTLYTNGYNQTRIGLWMAWSGNRLFVADGTNVYASDIGDPLHFTEMLTETSLPSINLPFPVTGMADRGTSGNVNSQCLIFCHNETYAVYSGVQQRIPDSTNGYPGWQGTPNFLSKIFAGTGCVAGKTVINHRGLIYWLSEWGIVYFDSINNVTSSQNMPAINAQEAYSNAEMGPNQSLACAGTFNSYAFWSVTTGGTQNGSSVNAQTQVLDRQPMADSPDEQFAWQGIWTGVNPVEWATVEVFGLTRCYCLSLDNDAIPRIYEAFQANCADNGQAIPWSVETPLHTFSSVFDRLNLNHARVFLQNITGNLSMQFWWKGTRGTWHKFWKTPYFVTATRGSILTPIAPYSLVQDGTPLVSFLPQVRDIRTPALVGSPAPGECDSGPVEAEQIQSATDRSDRAFAFRFEFLGRGTLTAYRVEAEDYPQPTEGQSSDPETGFHILPGTGCPELLGKGEIPPEYFMPDDNPTGLVTAFIPDRPQHFSSDSAYSVPQPESIEQSLDALSVLFPCLGEISPQICQTYGQVSGTTVFSSKNDAMVKLRIAGVAERNQYSGGTQGNGWYAGGSGGGNNIYKLEISDPPQVYFLNPGPNLIAIVQVWDYTNEIRINSGATITLSADSVDGHEAENFNSLVAPGCPEVSQPYDGQFMVMQVIGLAPIT